MDKPASLPDPQTEAALRSLKDIVIPAPVSWFPQSWGWIALAVILAAVLLAMLVRRVLRYRADRYRRDALLELRALEPGFRDPATRAHAVQALAELLKRTALAAWPRPDIASLSGAAWIAFLKKQDDNGVGEALATMLADLEYQDAAGLRSVPADFAADVVAGARQWIERHHVSA
jgi:hypothetical protein